MSKKKVKNDLAKFLMMFLIGLAIFLPLENTFAADNPATASFVGIDSATQGNWRGKYGSAGYQIATDMANLPSFASVNFINKDDFNDYIWATSTNDVRALQKVESAHDRFASAWYNSSFTLAVNQTDNAIHQIALYVLDWDNRSRVQTIQVLDAQTGNIVDSQTVSNFRDGKYLIWNIKGNAVFLITSTGETDAAVSGIFFDPQGGSVTAPGFPNTGGGNIPRGIILPIGVVIILILFYLLIRSRKEKVNRD